MENMYDVADCRRGVPVTVCCNHLAREAAVLSSSEKIKADLPSLTWSTHPGQDV